MYDVFVRLCQKNGVSAYAVAKATHITQSTFSEWKKGRSKPNPDKLKKIADYFNVSVDYLMTGKDPVTADDSPYYTDPEVRKLANDIYENPQLRILMDASKDMSKEDIDMVTELVRKIKKTQEE